MSKPELDKALQEFAINLAKSQQPLESEFEKVYWDNWWELLE